MILDFFRRWWHDDNADIDRWLFEQEQDAERAAELQRLADDALWRLDRNRAIAGFIGYDDLPEDW
jgi:hypothetical protein